MIVSFLTYEHKTSYSPWDARISMYSQAYVARLSYGSHAVSWTTLNLVFIAERFYVSPADWINLN